MSRPIIDRTGRREAVLHIRLQAADLDTFNQAADAKGMSRSAWILKTLRRASKRAIKTPTSITPPIDDKPSIP